MRVKEHILVAGDEIVLRDLDPILVSNKRIYIRRGYSKRSKKMQIIQLDKVSSVRYIKKRHPLLRVMMFLFLFLGAVFAGVLFYLRSTDGSLYDRLKMPLWIGGIVSVVFALLFLFLFLFVRKKAVRIEYPGDHFQEAVLIRKGSDKKLIELVRSFFWPSTDFIPRTSGIRRAATTRFID